MFCWTRTPTPMAAGCLLFDCLVVLKPAHTVAEKCDNLSHFSATVAEKCDCRRCLAVFATVALFCDSVDRALMVSTHWQ